MNALIRYDEVEKNDFNTIRVAGVEHTRKKCMPLFIGVLLRVEWLPGRRSAGIYPQVSAPLRLVAKSHSHMALIAYKALQSSTVSIVDKMYAPIVSHLYGRVLVYG